MNENALKQSIEIIKGKATSKKPFWFKGSQPEFMLENQYKHIKKLEKSNCEDELLDLLNEVSDNRVLKAVAISLSEIGGEKTAKCFISHLGSSNSLGDVAIVGLSDIYSRQSLHTDTVKLAVDRLYLLACNDKEYAIEDIINAIESLLIMDVLKGKEAIELQKGTENTGLRFELDRLIEDYNL